MKIKIGEEIIFKYKKRKVMLKITNYNDKCVVGWLRCDYKSHARGTVKAFKIKNMKKIKPREVLWLSAS